MNDKARKVIVALDTPDLKSAEAVVQKLHGKAAWFKVGMELFYAAGWDAVKMVSDAGANVFLDLKFNDIPNTVAGACRSCLRPGVGMLNMHASAGAKAMSQAASEVAKAGQHMDRRPLIIGVTVLTSIDQTALNAELGMQGPIEDNVVRLARLCQSAGLDGVVASPLEVAAIKRATGPNFIVVTPGVRPAWSETGDQKRFTTPRQAMDNGADLVVIGRPITAAADPAEAFAKVCEEIE